MIKNRRTTLERVEKFISPLYFTDINLYGQIYSDKRNVETLEHFTSNQERITFNEAVGLKSKFTAISVGQTFGPTWSTHWFKLRFSILSTWHGKEIHLRWNAGCEALLYNEKGHPLQGFSGGVQERTDYILTEAASDSSSQLFYIEMACNTIFGAGLNCMIAPPDPEKQFTLQTAEIAIFDREVYSLMLSLECLHDMAKELPETNPRSFDALYTANEMVNVIQLHSKDYGRKKALEISKNFFCQKNGSTQHQIIAVGHCHIDSAWLWPYAETIRKCARSWSSTLRLMEKYPDFTFACSQAQQFEWVKDRYPSLYTEIKQAVARNRFLPVGATWVEMDGNLPSGESFIRQFLYGQKFFLKEFDMLCQEFWLPDTFGYSAQLPQIMRLFGLDSFLTQKLSWNLVNKFPHHNFIWEGIDGSNVLAHFPPGESYTMEVKVKEAVKQVTNLEDKGRVSQSLMLFGYGDGGGGPNEDMLQRRQFLQDVDGIAKIKLGKPGDLFEHLKAKKEKLCKWVGELFLEMHNGTYTTQAKTKQLNRECEFLLRNVEILLTVCCALNPLEKKTSLHLVEVENMWKKVLLNQFHDVLPGSSIGMVHDEACKIYEEVKKKAETLTSQNICGVVGSNTDNASFVESYIALNTLSWPRTEIVSIPNTKNFINEKDKITSDENILVPMSIQSMGCKALVDSLKTESSVNVNTTKDYFILSNQYLEAHISKNGQIFKITLNGDNRELIPTGLNGNQLVLFDDVPLYWDAWDVMDYHLETRRQAITELINKVSIEENNPLKVSLKFKAKIGENSSLIQRISLDAVSPYLRFDTTVDWHENHKFLKVEFPVNVISTNATYEIQFGHLQRPNHFNTSWDWARFEVCGHKWMDMSEHGFGMAILNTGKYGHSAKGNIMSLSLLRSPKLPDPNADMGEQNFTYALMPHRGSFQEAGVINRAYELNSPLLIHETYFSESFCQKSWFEVSSPAVILETVKISEFNQNVFVLRLYESYGSHCKCNITTCLDVSFLSLCNGMEKEIEDRDCNILSNHINEIQINVKPFQIISLLYKFN